MKHLNFLHIKKTLFKAALLSCMGLLSSSPMLEAQTLAKPSLCYSFDGKTTDAISGIDADAYQIQYTTGKGSGKDSAAMFNGSYSSYITLPVADSLKPSEITISCWVKANDIMNSQYVIFSKNKASSDFEGFVLGIINSQFKLIKNNPDSNSYSICASSAINANQWYHIGMVYTGDSLKLYVDGSLVEAKASATAIEYDTNTGFVLGGSNQSFNLPFNGAIDNFKIYNEALATNDIQKLYTNNPVCGSAPKFQGNMYLTFDGNLDDASKNKYIVTGTNVSYGSDMAGLTNNALVMDGSAYLTMPSGFIPSSARQFSLSLWFNTSETNRPNGLGWAGAQTVNNYPSNYTPIMWLDSNGYLNGFIYDGTITSPVSKKKLNDGKWHHVAFQLFVNPGNGALIQSLWVDGVMDASKSGMIAGNPSFTNMYIGTCNARGINGNMPDQWFHFKGMLDEIHVNFNYLDDQMLKNYDMGFTKHPISQSLAVGQTLTLEAKHTDFSNGVSYTYQWFKDGQVIAGATNQVYTKTMTSNDTGAYECEVTNNTSMLWNIRSEVANITLANGNNGVNIAESVGRNNRVYPNPAHDVLYIQNPCKVSVYSLTGQLILQENIINQPLYIGHLDRGMYYVKTTIDGVEQVHQLILQ